MAILQDQMNKMPLAPVLLLVMPLWGYQPRIDLNAGRFLKALAEAESRLKSEPGDALAWAAKSQALTSMQRCEEALAAAERALALNPQLADGFQARGLARAGVAVQARNFSTLRNALGALDDLELATQRDPSLATAWMTRAIAYQTLPGILGGSTRKALACAESLRKFQAPRADALQGWILAAAGRWSEAEPFFGRALASAPADPELVYLYLEALGQTPTRKALGETEQRRRQASEARRLLPPVQNRAKAIEAITDALLEGGQPEEAWRVAKTALDRVDAPSLIRLQLGKLAAKSQPFKEEGLAQLNRLLTEPLEGGSGGLPALHWRRGQLLRDLGRKDEAQVAALEALKYDPKHPGAKRLLEMLRN